MGTPPGVGTFGGCFQVAFSLGGDAELFAHTFHGPGPKRQLVEDAAQAVLGELGRAKFAEVLEVGEPHLSRLRCDKVGAMSSELSQPQILQLAAEHDLELDPRSLRVIEMGLDFRVVIAQDTAGEKWVLRIPRFAGVMQRAAVEARLLHLVKDHLDIAVPDWRIHSEHLIAYPLLPGEPGLELDQKGEPVWLAEISSTEYAQSLGALLAQLHQIPVELASGTGVTVHNPEQTRTAWHADVAKVTAEFTVAPALLDRWRKWLADDSYWPEHSVLTHGEIYPGHTLVKNNQITGVIDWTTAAVGDPARDLMFQQAMATPEAFQVTVDRYRQNGGTIWPRLAEHCAEMFATSPLGYGLYALETGSDTHLAAAAAGLNPQD